MDKLNDGQIKLLAQSGILMDNRLTNTRTSYDYLQLTNNISFSLIGVPIGVERKHINNTSFPIEKFKQYTSFLKNRRTGSNEKREFYVIPLGMLEIDYLQNEEIDKKIEQWNALVEEASHTSFNDISTETLNISREIFSIIYLDSKNKRDVDLGNICNRNFLYDYFCGQEYREFLERYNSNEHEKLMTDEEGFKQIQNLFKTQEDLVEFEKMLTTINDRGYYHLNEIELNFWNKIVNELVPMNSYKVFSPVLEDYRLKNHNYYRTQRAGSDFIHILKILERYEFSLIKDEFIHFYNSTKKKDVLKYVKEVLTKHNALPKESINILVSQESSVIYKNVMTYDLNYIKKAIDGNLHPATTLAYIINEAYSTNEKEPLSFNLNVLAEKGIIQFVIESDSKEKTMMLSERLNQYVDIALGQDFLNDEMKKTISKHGLHRREYEKQKDVMEKFDKIKEIVLAKNKLDKQLSSKSNIVKDKVNKI